MSGAEMAVVVMPASRETSTHASGSCNRNGGVWSETELCKAAKKVCMEAVGLEPQATHHPSAAEQMIGDKTFPIHKQCSSYKPKKGTEDLKESKMWVTH